ncbi:MAG TPA: protein kinase [Gemmatales bacterium]|nr:protein kinase [Gemmatales bacterium]
MYLTESDPTHTCTVSIVANPMVPSDDAEHEFETTDGEHASLLEQLDPPDLLDLPVSEDDRIIGRYRLMRSLGRGTTGIVWLAQDMDKVGRDVALKIMHADEHDEYVMARYTCEVRALVRMDDPHIARIWENGQTADGKLYIAMELVQGVQLSKFCEAWSPQLRERIALVIKICRGLQHAHQRGILHRDLKPANILVTHHDGEAIPKIIDFGLAKSFHKPLLPGSADTTQMGCLLGTIGYMSPEQANTATREVDTRSDVYSVCAILYELLTGTLPIPREELNRVSLAKALEMIQHREPDLVSRRVQKDKAQATHAARCQLQPPKLIALLQGDLDAILQKGLSKERDQRYQSAGELADDLERYLTGGVVHARRRTSWYVIYKLLRRNWKTALTVCFLSVMFFVSWVGMAFGIFWALQSRDEARTAQSSLQTSQEHERSLKLDAEKSSSFLEQVLSYPQPNKMGQDIKLLDTLELAQAKIRSSFSEQPRAEMMVRLALARSYLRLGNGARARELIEPILERNDITTAEHKLHWIQAESLMIQSLISQEYFDEAMERCRSLLAQSPDLASPTLRPQWLSLYPNYAKLLVRQQKFEEAVQMLENVLHSPPIEKEGEISEIWMLRNTHAAVLCDWAKQDKEISGRAIYVLRGYLEQAKTMKPTAPMLIHLQSRLAELYSQDGDVAQAKGLLEHLLDTLVESYGEDHMNTKMIQGNLSQLYLKQGQLRQARGLLLKILTWQRARFGAQHELTQQTLSALSSLSENQGRYWQALGFSEELYEGQCLSLTKSNPLTQATLKQCQTLACKAGMQWMVWSLGGW